MPERSPQKIKKLREHAERLRFFSRSSLYIARTIALVFLGVTLCVLSFVFCARLANLYILVNEGMALRIDFNLLSQWKVYQNNRVSEGFNWHNHYR